MSLTASASASLTEDHAAFSRFYLPRLREWDRQRCDEIGDDLIGGDDRITTLVLEGRHMTDADCIALADALAVNGSLTYLSMANNPSVTADGVAAVASAIADHPRMAVLRLVGESDLSGPDSDVAPADLEASANPEGFTRADASVAWIPVDMQGAADPIPEQALKGTAAGLDLRAVAAAFRAIEHAALTSPTLRRLFLPPPPSARMLCSITGSEITLGDEADFFGTPDEKDAKVLALELLRGCHRSTTAALAAAKLNLTTGGHGNWKKCFVAGVGNSTALEEASHDLSKAASAGRAVGLSSAAALRVASTLVAGALVRCATIRRVDLSGFGAWMGDAGAEAIAATLFNPEANTKETCALTELNLADNDITGHGALALFEGLASGSGNRHLVELDLTANRVTDKAAKRLLELVRKCAFGLAYVGIDRNCVTPTVVASVMQNMALNSQPAKFRQVLQELESDNVATTRAVFNQQAATVRLNGTSCRLLMHALRPNTRIVHIDVSMNDITDDGAVHLAEVVAGNRTLRKMIAQANRISDSGAALLLAAIPRNPAIELVDLADQRPAPLSDAMLARLRWLSSLNTHPMEIKSKGLLILQNDASLDAIRIAGYDGQRRLTEQSVAVLCEMLQENQVVTSLTIANHPPSEKIELAPILPDVGRLVGHRLTHLDLSNNALTDANSLGTMGDMLSSPAMGAASIKTLCLSGNDFSSDAASRFVDILRSSRNDTLTQLDLSGNRKLSDVDHHRIDFASHLNAYGKAFKTLVLSVDGNDASVTDVSLKQVEKSVPWGSSYHFVRRYDDRAAVLLAEALERNSRVTSVDLTGNEIADVGAAALAEMLKINSSVTALHLTSNDISDVGLAALQRGLLEAHSIRILTFDGNRRLKDPAIRKSIQLSLAQNASANKDEHGPKTAAVYSSALSGKRAKLTRAAAEDRIVDDAIFDDAMADFHAAQRRKAQLQKQQAAEERRQQESELQQQHVDQLGGGSRPNSAAAAAASADQESKDVPADATPA